MVSLHDDRHAPVVRRAVFSDWSLSSGTGAVMTLLLSLITVQALLGAIDNLWHHEITERLPSKRSAAGELSLHAVRELLYAFVFIALAWFEWRGAWAALIAAVMLI